jgi:hypothetical protein
MFAICLQSSADPTLQNVNPEIKQLLEEFEELPPTRGVDHHIVLKEGT